MTIDERRRDALDTLTKLQIAVKMNLFHTSEIQRDFDTCEILWHTWMLENGATPDASLTHHIEPFIEGFVKSHAPVQAEDGVA